MPRNLEITVPECDRWAQNLDLGQNGSSEGVAYLSRLSGAIISPVVNGFTWPENLAPKLYFNGDIPLVES